MDEEDAPGLLPTRKAARVIGVSSNTLRTYANQGKIRYELTPGGQRRFDVSSLQRATAPRIDIQDRSKKTSKGAVYCRVSSDKQKERQVEAMEARFPGYQVFTDVASGLNYKRKGLTRLLERAQSGAIEEVVVAHRDRLARFGVE